MKGIDAGEVCNRENCKGIIKEKEKEGGCSCHLGFAPCSYCTQGCRYCDTCDWEEEDV
jgi:hypothetical protein